jgi:hypothetical protein
LSSTDGVNWGNKGTPAQTTFASDGPALVADRGSLVIGWTGTDTKLNDAFSADGQHFGAANTFGAYDNATSQYAPALAVGGNGDLIVAWTGTDNRVNWKDLETGAGYVLPTSYSHNAPSLAGVGDVFLAWTGKDDNQIMIHDISTLHTHPTNEYSYNGPSLTFDRTGTRFIAWTGTDGFGPFAGSLNWEVA